MTTLLSTAGHHVGRRFQLGAATTLGRAPDNDIVLPDNLVSRYHVRIEREGNAFVARDLDSKNGLMVNERRRLESRLQRGDRLRVGETVLVFEAPQELKTARYTNTLIHLDPEKDESLRVADRPASRGVAPEEAASLVARLANIFEIAGADLPEAMKRILGSIVELFGATGGSVFLRGRSGEIQPLAALARGDELHLNREAARMALDEGKAVLVAAFRDGAAEGPGAGRFRPRAAMIAPLFDKGVPFGAIHVERPEGNEYSLDDTAFLHGVCRLVSGAVRQAIRIDQLGQGRESDGARGLIVGTSRESDELRRQIERLAPTDATVLITGETGTGKELIARALHERGLRAGGPFVAINCAAIPAQLLESELFGHERGAFTGADALKRGKVEMADGGTLLLDEIGELGLALQPKLLRFLEERLFYRVGGTRPIQTDVRIVAATNRDLEREVAEGRFRQDLLFRLNVLLVRTVPLRDRREDVRALVERFAPEIAARVGRPYLGIEPEAWAALEAYRWPGNVRELLQSLERALVLGDGGVLTAENFQLAPALSPSDSSPTGTQRSPPRGGAGESLSVQTAPEMQGYPTSLAEAERRAIVRALAFAEGNRNRAAELLEIHRNTLRKKMQEYGIS